MDPVIAASFAIEAAKLFLRFVLAVLEILPGV